MKNKKSFIILGICLFIFTRFLYLFFISDADIKTDFRLMEVSYTGVIAKHLIDGLIMPFWDYQFSSYDGGTLITALMILPFFLLFGDSSFSLTLYALTNYLCIFLLWWRFMHIYFSARIGLITAILFIFAPPYHIKAQLLPSGNHMEVSFYIILIISLFFHIFYKSDPNGSMNRPYKDRDFIIFGLISGLSIYFCYSSAVALLNCGIFWYMMNKKDLTLRHYLYYAVFFIIGISFIIPRLPLFYNPVQQDIVTRIVPTQINDIGIRIIGVFFSQLPAFFTRKSPIHIISYVIFILSTFTIIWRSRCSLKKHVVSLLPLKHCKIYISRDSIGLFLITFIGLYLSIYILSDFNTYADVECPIKHRYLLLLYPFIFAVSALGIDHLINSQNRYLVKTAYSILAFLIILNIWVTPQQLDLNSISHRVNQKMNRNGFSHEMLGTVICSRLAIVNPLESIRLLNSVQKQYIPDMYRGFGYEYAVSELPQFEEFITLVENDEYRLELLRGYGIGTATNKYMNDSIADEAYLGEILATEACKSPLKLKTALLQYVDYNSASEKYNHMTGLGVIQAIQCNLEEVGQQDNIKSTDQELIRAFYDGLSNGIKYNNDIKSFK